MGLIDDLLSVLLPGDIVEVSIGLRWTAAVAVIENGRQQCGLASTLSVDHMHGETDVPQAGKLEATSSADLAALIRSDKLTLSSVGMAVINALIPHQPERWVEKNAVEVIAELGEKRKVVVIGHFPFVERLKAQVGELFVLERQPFEGDLPIAAGQEIIPQAEVVAITGMALINKSLENLLRLCEPQTKVILVGPSVPLHPVLFDYGIDMLAGSFVERIDTVLKVVRQGGNFRQVRQAGVALVTMEC
ncbi:MAG: DUF364 domain-containing protein [Chloroflexota bacterium]